MVAVTESLVDAKDEARQAEVRSDLSEALRGVERTIFRQTKWLAGLLLDTLILELPRLVGGRCDDRGG
ncbi:MAG: hypothetical protein OXS29_01815, partial [bacterium]|nr:hypothetical protein [bacterium]